MAMFVHFAPQRRIKSILRSGIARLRRGWNGSPGGIFSLPVTQNFYATHQWLRELRRFGRGTQVAVYFRIPDEEPVWFGHFGQSHLQMPADDAVSAMMHGPQVDGFEVIIPRKISAREIHRVKALPQIVGWRYFPGSHERKPCACPYCQRGQYGGQRIRAADRAYYDSR